MDLVPDRFNGKTTKVINGRKLNRAYYWSEAAKSNPSWCSSDNMNRIAKGISPLPDKQFIGE